MTAPGPTRTHANKVGMGTNSATAAQTVSARLPKTMTKSNQRMRRMRRLLQHQRLDGVSGKGTEDAAVRARVFVSPTCGAINAAVGACNAARTKGRKLIPSLATTREMFARKAAAAINIADGNLN